MTPDIRKIPFEYKPSKQAAKFHAMRKKYRYVIFGWKSGKCLHADQSVLRANGTTMPAGSLRPGDPIMGCEKGIASPTIVTAVERARKPCIELIFTDGTVVRCSEDHRFPVHDTKTGEEVVRHLIDVLSFSEGKQRGKQKAKYHFLAPREVDFAVPPMPLAVDPYLLGLILGDAGITTRSIIFTNTSPELLEAFVQTASPFNIKLKATTSISYTAFAGERDLLGRSQNRLVRTLDAMGLMGKNSHTKFIPRDYLLATAEDRLQLLAGLIDTDGYVYNKSRVVEYCSMSSKMADGVAFIVRSLGGSATITRGHVGQYRVRLALNRAIPTRVPYKKYSGKLYRDKTHRGLRNWKRIGMQDCVHISVACPSQLFLLDNFIVTHNTMMGAAEAIRISLARPGHRRPGISWIVAPTYKQLREPQLAFEEFLNQFQGPWFGRIWKYRSRDRIYELVNRHFVECHSAEHPENLRGSNVSGFIWRDEAAHMKEAADDVTRSRMAARPDAVLFDTSTPKGRNWWWRRCCNSGLPADGRYGEFGKGDRWVSHHPTWVFPWVSSEFIRDERNSMPKDRFQQEYGAQFLTDSRKVFPEFQKCISYEPPPERIEGVTIMGIDPAKYQDWFGVIIMDRKGHVRWVDRWQKQTWSRMKGRIVTLARQWNSGIMVDRANMGSTIEEDLKGEKLAVSPVDLNAWQNKREIIEALQISLERNYIRIPSPTCTWAPSESAQLLKELDWYDADFTKGGKISYSAPRGLTDDLVIALALANWGRLQGMAGSLPPAAIMLGANHRAGRDKAMRDMGLGNRRRAGSVFARPRRSLVWDSGYSTIWR